MIWRAERRCSGARALFRESAEPWRVVAYLDAITLPAEIHAEVLVKPLVVRLKVIF